MQMFTIKQYKDKTVPRRLKMRIIEGLMSTFLQGSLLWKSGILEKPFSLIRSYKSCEFQQPSKGGGGCSHAFLGTVLPRLCPTMTPNLPYMEQNCTQKWKNQPSPVLGNCGSISPPPNNMDLSSLKHGFLYVDTWISLCCFMDLSKLLHGFVNNIKWICQSCSLYFSPFAKPNKAKVWPRFQSLLRLLLCTLGNVYYCLWHQDCHQDVLRDHDLGMQTAKLLAQAHLYLFPQN